MWKTLYKKAKSAKKCGIIVAHPQDAMKQRKNSIFLSETSFLTVPVRVVDRLLLKFFERLGDFYGY